MNATPRPWKVLWKYDTHKVKRDRDGRIIGPVTMDFDDYLHALHCVNTHERAITTLKRVEACIRFKAPMRDEINALLADMEG